MQDRMLRRLVVLVALVLTVLPLASLPAYAAQPGEDVLNGEGTLSPGETFTTPILSSGAANLRLIVSGTGSAATDTLTMTVQQPGTSGMTDVKSWVVRNGETAWGFATLPSNGQLVIHNNSSAATLNYKLNGYARGTTANIAGGQATWSGTARGAGIQSAVQIDVLSAGLYAFTLNAASGSYQIDVDSNYILKTVVKDRAPSASDSIYYLSAGTHTFTIKQLAAADTTSWSMKLDLVGSADALPSSENSAQLGGGTFSEEWIPLNVAANQPVNVRVEATGGNTQSLTVQLYNGSSATPNFESTKIFGGEVIYGSSQLTAGSNRIRVVADGNTTPLAYTVTISAIPQTPLNWTGITYKNTTRPNAGHSTAQVAFPKDALYNFKLGASTGRFQLLVDDTYIQKIVTDTASTAFTAFVPAGTHRLEVAQDAEAATTTWSVEVSPTATLSDALPFQRAGGTLEKPAANAFSQEWLPIRVTAAQAVNMKLSVSGAPSDAVKLELCNASGQNCRSSSVFGSEVFWAKDALTAGTNLLHITTSPTNTGKIDYQIAVQPVAAIPSTWQGIARDNGGNSTVQLNAPVNGVYNVTLNVSEGAGQVVIDGGQQTPSTTIRANGSTVTLRVELTRGLHTFTFRQNTSTPTQHSVWEMSTSLRRSNQQFVYLPFVRR